VQQDGDVRGWQFEHRRHVLARNFVQHPQRNDRPLQLPEVIEAPHHERKVLRLRDQLVDGQRLGGENVEGLIARIMGARDRVSAASIPRVVSNQNRQQLERILVRLDQLPSLWQHEERVERVLNGIERILFSQSLSPRQAVEPSSVGMHQSRHPFEKSR
jgi:hypothetical protein